MRNIVLAHGILGFSSINLGIAQVNYFNGIAAHLRTSSGAKVLAPAVDPTAGIQARATMLHDAIKAALQPGDPLDTGDRLDPSQPVHIIAHSMGGLDARYMIHFDNTIDLGGGRAVPVKSVAMIGTPNLGSPIADWLWETPFRRNSLLGDLGDPHRIESKFLKPLGLSLDGLHDLTKDSMTEFNKNYGNHRDVDYFSYAGKGCDHHRPGFLVSPTSLAFDVFYKLIKFLHPDEDNDGLVTVSSAHCPEAAFDDALWPCDHADEVGHNLDIPFRRSPQDLLDRYDAIVAKFKV